MLDFKSMQSNITFKDIINYCGEKSFNKGRKYLGTDSLFIRYKDYLGIRAFCETISIDNYIISVDFGRKVNKNKYSSVIILNSSCTCKNNIIGPCEHIAALLLTWYHSSETFKNKKELAKNLKIKKKEYLVNLIEKMVASCYQNESILHGIS